jgi:hypothetical protein
MDNTANDDFVSCHFPNRSVHPAGNYCNLISEIDKYFGIHSHLSLQLSTLSHVY